MDFKKLFENNKAVSPVIGVILMVAITVILAAAIGSSVFGQGTTESAPKANFDIKVAPDSNNSNAIRIEHLGGDPIHFEDATKTKVMASVSGNPSVLITEANEAIANGGLGVFDVGSVDILELTNGTVLSVQDGETVNIKIIDVETNQLICDKDVRF